MQDYVKAMKKRESELKKAIMEAMRISEGFPEGRLRISQTEKRVRYYQVL